MIKTKEREEEIKEEMEKQLKEKGEGRLKRKFCRMREKGRN